MSPQKAWVMACKFSVVKDIFKFYPGHHISVAEIHKPPKGTQYLEEHTQKTKSHVQLNLSNAL